MSAKLDRIESARRHRVEVATGNPIVFGEVYVRPFDENWDGPLPKIAREMLGFSKAVRRGVLMTPPEFLKTTIVSQLYPLWLIYRYAALGELARLTIMLLSEEEELAKRNLSVTAWHIENNPRLAADFLDTHHRPLVEPDPDEDKWTDDALIVRRPGVSKDTTMVAKGINSQGIQGTRIRHLIGDDVVTPRSAGSPAIQRKAKRLWDTQVTTRVFEDGQAIIAGNFNHPRDLLSELAAKPSYALMKRPALHLPGSPSEAPEGPRDADAVEALPERWPRRRLLLELAEKPHSFASVYFLRAGEEGGGALRVEWVSRISLDQIPRLDRVYLLALDPAPGAEVDPDPSFFTITVGCLTPTHLDIVETYADRSEASSQVEKLAAMVARYQEEGHVGGIGISKVSLDRYFSGAVVVGHPELRPLLHSHSIPGDKVERLSHLGSYFRSGWMRITEAAWQERTSGPDDRDQEESLAEQFETFPFSGHDDRLDGLDILQREARDRMGTRTVMASEVDTSGLTDGSNYGITGDLLGYVF